MLYRLASLYEEAPQQLRGEVLNLVEIWIKHERERGLRMEERRDFNRLQRLREEER